MGLSGEYSESISALYIGTLYAHMFTCMDRAMVAIEMLTLTASSYPAQGTHPETVLHCNVEGMVEPLLLVLSAQVHGLAVSYAVKERG